MIKSACNLTTTHVKLEFQLTWKKGVPLLSYRRCYLSSRRKNNNSTHIKEIKPLVLAAGSYFWDVEVFMLIAAFKSFCDHTNFVWKCCALAKCRVLMNSFAHGLTEAWSDKKIMRISFSKMMLIYLHTQVAAPIVSCSIHYSCMTKDNL